MKESTGLILFAAGFYLGTIVKDKNNGKNKHSRTP